MSELERCHFCGGGAYFTDELIDVDKFEFVACYDCNARTDGFLFNTAPKSSIADEWNTRADCWISVDDRLPSVGAHCLIYMSRKGFSINNIVTAQFTKYGFERSNVTHWQLLPNPPKGD